MDSLVKVLDDEVIPEPPRALSATVVEMQAKNDALQYHANVKITVLSMAAEQLDSTVLRQAASSGQALDHTKNLIANIQDLYAELTDHPQLQDLLVTEGAICPVSEYKDEEEPALVLPENPADGTICQTLVALYKLTTETEKWRVDFKKIPRETQETWGKVTEELAHFPASKAHLQNHSKENSGILDEFKTWVARNGNKVTEAEDNFKAWEKGIQAMTTTRKTTQNKELTVDTIAGIHHSKRTPATMILGSVKKQAPLTAPLHWPRATSVKTPRKKMQME